jgi:hypothetical protein
LADAVKLMACYSILLIQKKSLPLLITNSTKDDTPLLRLISPMMAVFFVGLYNHNGSTFFEPHPEGTSLSYPIKLNQSDKHTTAMRGTDISIPIPSPQSGLPVSDKEASPYVIRLIDGSIHCVSPDLME